MGRMQTFDTLRQQLLSLDAGSEQYATHFVETVLAVAHQLDASDVHFLPTGDGLSLSARIDGVLQPVGQFPTGKVSDVVARLKVRADLLTYRTDLPQEGRVRGEMLSGEIRVSTFPTLHGEKAVIRLFAAETKFQFVEHLGLPSSIESRLAKLSVGRLSAVRAQAARGCRWRGRDGRFSRSASWCDFQKNFLRGKEAAGEVRLFSSAVKVFAAFISGSFPGGCAKNWQAEAKWIGNLRVFLKFEGWRGSMENKGVAAGFWLLDVF
ncbi:MAG: Flp pilus assembly complex ATPase component TadA [Pirellulales bacterium]|nr:Flp pilus assembly complex ATPase component TadA [Pirellulales bacterium]